MSEERYSLKDELFNKETVLILTNAIESVYDDFEKEEFIEEIMSEMTVLELKERIKLIRKKIQKYLPDDFNTTTALLLKALNTVEKGVYFVFASFSEYVEVVGCSEEFLETSLELLGEYTKWFSAEFAIRRFINEYPEQTYKKLWTWSKSADTDQRRLASEGLRPKLPWAKKILFSYEKGIEPLDNLFYDQERYVVRSVANHLNDIAKIDPDLVVTVLDRWQKSKRQNEKEMAYLINHALRTSIKKGHEKSLEFIGYRRDAKIKIENFEIEKKNLMLGDNLEFSFDIQTLKQEKLMIDYQITYPMAKGKTSVKVFKLKKITLDQKIKKIQKKHAFKRMTTKKLYSGDYKITLQINGKLYNEGTFTLKV